MLDEDVAALRKETDVLRKKADDLDARIMSAGGMHMPSAFLALNDGLQEVVTAMITMSDAIAELALIVKSR